MRFTPLEAADPGDFFAVSGWSSQTSASSIATERGGEHRSEHSSFTATVAEGEPRVGERYRFQQDDGQTILIQVSEVVRPEAGEELVVHGEIIGR